MQVSKTITSTVILKPEELTNIIKEHMAKKGFNVTGVEYNVETTYPGYGDYPVEEFTKVIITQTETIKQDI